MQVNHVLLNEPIIQIFGDAIGLDGDVSQGFLAAGRPSSARSLLRAATHDIHDRMHHHPPLARLAAGTIGRNEYCRVLVRSYGFYTMAEPALGLSGRWTACLRDDIAELGMTSSAIDDLPRCAPLDVCQSQADIIGARYVLYGASLGGKVMARAISGHTKGQAELPVRFLTAMAQNEWTAFAADLEKNLSNASLRTCAANAAIAMFRAYEEWMTTHE